MAVLCGSGEHQGIVSGVAEMMVFLFEIVIGNKNLECIDDSKHRAAATLLMDSCECQRRECASLPTP